MNLSRSEVKEKVFLNFIKQVKIIQRKKTQKLLPHKADLDGFLFTRCYLVLLLIISSVAQ